MALRRTNSGQYVITTQKEAESALELFLTLQDEVNEIREEHGLQEIEQDQVELKKAVTGFMLNKGITDIKIPTRGDKYGKLIEQGYDRRIIATAEELEDYLRDGKELVKSNVIPLRRLLIKKFGKGSKGFKTAWRRATKPIADVPALEAMVAEEILTVKELEKCYVEKKKSPYLRIFGDE